MYDFNNLERRASELIAVDRVADALKVYLYMADGDPSLDGGYLGQKLGECYERIGDLHAAKYWYRRAVEENPELRAAAAAALLRLEPVSIDALINPDGS